MTIPVKLSFDCKTALNNHVLAAYYLCDALTAVITGEVISSSETLAQYLIDQKRDFALYAPPVAPAASPELMGGV